MEEVGDKFVIYLSLSSSDGWANRSCEQELGRFAKEPSDRTPQSVGSHSATGEIFL
jgi:hypothetical protein